MALQDILDLSEKRKKIGISEERITNIIPHAREYIAFWREYPDLFVDFMSGGGFDGEEKRTFKLFFYQRIFLRAAIRYKYAYMVFPRAYSKSFLSILALMVRSILHPRSKLFVTSGGKEQAAGIIKEKVEEICTLMPAFAKEIEQDKGKGASGKDYVKYVFKNESYFDNIAARESSRGKRRHGGLIEEVIGVDGNMLSSVIIPTMNISRMCMDGTTQPDESLNKSQIYVTTAGYRNTFPYDKLIQVLIWQIVHPDRAITLGGTYRIPVLVGLLDKNFIKDLKMDGTFNEASFDKEYESKWAGASEDAFFKEEAFDRNRVINQVQYEFSNRNTTKGTYYVIGADVGRKGDASVFEVLRVTPQPNGDSIKSLVNLYTMENAHFEDQAIMLKRLFYKYKARRIIVDGNGIGAGLLDYMVKKQIDHSTGDEYTDFGVMNDKEGIYKKYRTNDTETDALYIIMANAPFNTAAHTIIQSQLSSGKVKFLIDERTAKNKLLGTVKGSKMTPEQRAEYLKPYTLTSILKEEMLNLREENEGVNIILRQANKKIKKDKFSALEYALYYIKEVEDTGKKKKKFNAKEWRFFS